LRVLALVIRDAHDHSQITAVVSERPQHRCEAATTAEYHDRPIRL
jgi:hypothetical protein